MEHTAIQIVEHVQTRNIINQEVIRALAIKGATGELLLLEQRLPTQQEEWK